MSTNADTNPARSTPRGENVEGNWTIDQWLLEDQFISYGDVSNNDGRVMSLVKRVVLDVLKPHQPNVLEFAQTIAGQSKGCRVKVTVLEVDDKTETLRVVIEADDLDFDAVQEVIADMGASLHSIDEVEVHATSEPRS